MKNIPQNIKHSNTRANANNLEAVMIVLMNFQLHKRLNTIYMK